MDAPIPFIIFNDAEKKLAVKEDALTELQKLEGKIAVRHIHQFIVY
jgi:hypothetical protein